VRVGCCFEDGRENAFLIVRAFIASVIDLVTFEAPDHRKLKNVLKLYNA
jgi:hypothetical protein